MSGRSRPQEGKIRAHVLVESGAQDGSHARVASVQRGERSPQASHWWRESENIAIAFCRLSWHCVRLGRAIVSPSLSMWAASPPQSSQGWAIWASIPYQESRQLSRALWQPASQAMQAVRTPASGCARGVHYGFCSSPEDTLLGRFVDHESRGWRDAHAMLELHESVRGGTWYVYLALRGAPSLLLMASVVHAHIRDRQTLAPSIRAPPAAGAASTP